MGFGKDGKGAILRENFSITVADLADQAVIKASSQISLDEDFRLIKVEYLVSYEGHTSTDLPIYVGVADNALSVTEIAECLNTQGPVDRNDFAASETAMRPCWSFLQLDANAAGDLPDSGASDERVFRWTFSNPEGWVWYAHNRAGVQLQTGTVIRGHAKYFGVWVT